MKPLDKEAIDKALDGRGRRYPETEHATLMIRRLARLAARSFYPGSAHHAAEKLHADIKRYRASAFRRATGPACEAKHRDTVNEIIHLMLWLRDRVPSARTIRRWL
jgi:hypothetical protein